jgi:hypothetical protein
MNPTESERCLMKPFGAPAPVGSATLIRENPLRPGSWVEWVEWDKCESS